MWVRLVELFPLRRAALPLCASLNRKEHVRMVKEPELSCVNLPAGATPPSVQLLVLLEDRLDIIGEMAPSYLANLIGEAQLNS